MTPRIRNTAQAASLRAGILLARQHMSRWPGIQYNLHGKPAGGHTRLFDRAYLRTKLRIGSTLLALRAADELQPLRRWLEHQLATNGVPVDERPTATTDLHRWGSCSLEYRDSHGARRVFFYVTTPDVEYVDRYLPRGPVGEFPPDGWTPAVDHDAQAAARRQLS